MAAISVNKPEDIKKLVGFVITDAMVGKPQNVPGDGGFTLRLHNPALEHDILATFSGDVQFGRSGNVVVANARTFFSVNDVAEPPTKEI
ncbi:MAG: hypothetical protein PHQ43_00090 [Dehalococcoidales bacterium]|nr:hypothetical protein [Dehalococcoidales bacterium]